MNHLLKLQEVGSKKIFAPRVIH